MQATVRLQSSATDSRYTGAQRIIIDAGVERMHVHCYDRAGKLLKNEFHTSSSVRDGSAWHGILGGPERQACRTSTFITGKLAQVVHDRLGHGLVIQPAAALWSAAQDLTRRAENQSLDSLAVIDLSASGYLLIGVDADGKLKYDLLVVNPRCGAGTGANIDRILKKLDIARDQVDRHLGAYLGEPGKQARRQLTVRADRCGVFSSSATISDKNQGIPLDFALAVTLKSEVMKTCKKLPAAFDKVYLTGGVFVWQFTRDCAEDYLRDIGVRDIAYDADQSLLIEGVRHLIEQVGEENFLQPERQLKRSAPLIELPSFRSLRDSYTAQNLYCRLPETPQGRSPSLRLEAVPAFIGLDVGSTMAKIVIADVDTEQPLFLESYSNQGDTIETIKQIFRDLQSHGVQKLRIARIGITGSARYQVQEILREIFPQLKMRISVLVENYAHARGSIQQAREHICQLKSLGISDINEDFFILVDIGGEDTKLSTVSLKKGELFDNAMNVKCSAGTGSLMDSLSALFGVESVAEASRRAFGAGRAFSINATCAVFLIENARKLQMQGHAEEEILASCSWAIVENMARTLWSQVHIPDNAVVLLHGQTMLSEPLPLAVTHRLQEFLGSPSYALVPSNPGHRACLGLIKTLAEQGAADADYCTLENLISREFTKRIVECRGAACGDRAARCNRTMLAFSDISGKRSKVTLGGCSAVNELIALKKAGIKVDNIGDSYKEIWEHINQRLPRSEDPDRLVIPRSFAVSEWAFFLGRIFQHLGLPVHTDNVLEQDLVTALPRLNTDTCAPQIGAVGQYARLAGEQHGVILVPQIEFLPTGGVSLGRTCTINQGGGLVAMNLAEAAQPNARFHLFSVDLSKLEPEAIAHQMYRRLNAVFEHYGMRPSRDVFRSAVDRALSDHKALNAELQELAADIVETALANGRQVGIVVGREYILNPGIYDSHIGRLLRDKQIVALPAYVLDVALDREYSHIYWRNPHAIVSVLRAVAQKRLHTILAHTRLRALFRHIETDPSAKLLPVVQVSTFRCGPDSVTRPLVDEIMKTRPFLLIQSDAVIKELAHLENRINTYRKQLDLGLHGQLAGIDGEPFDIAILDNFSSTRSLDRDKDVIYFPTLSDNRPVTSAIRAAGFTCIDNYDDETYSLVDLIKKGRRITGDAVCAPLAAVYGDILGAVEDFRTRKRTGDPAVSDKRRLLVFTNQGSGPCRQGQYAEVQKLFAYRTFGPPPNGSGPHPAPKQATSSMLQLLVGSEGVGYDIGIPEWSLVRAIQGIVLQGVLHGLLFKGGTSCRNFNEYQEFTREYRQLKRELYGILETTPGPGLMSTKLLNAFENLDCLATFIKYFAYGLHDRGVHRALRRFSDKWIDSRDAQEESVIKVYVDGEAYMRGSQAEDIFRHLLASLGFRRFTLDYAPVWTYLAYLLDEDAMVNGEKLHAAEDRLRADAAGGSQELRQFAIQHKESLARAGRLRIMFRLILARPLYKAAGLTMPAAIPSVLQVAREMVPTLKPYGELAPYVGEVLTRLREGYDLCLNVAPEGCMVSSMGANLTAKILGAAAGKGRIQNLFSADGEVDEELLNQAVLKALGPRNYYRSAARKSVAA